jgi:hypothetical protein
MKYLKTFNEKYEDSPNSTPAIYNSIKFLKKIPKEYKDVALSLVQSYTVAKNGKISGLLLHPDLEKRINDNNYPNGYSMGIDHNGYFIHTHRARSKSHESMDQITPEEMKFIDSTG